MIEISKNFQNSALALFDELRLLGFPKICGTIKIGLCLEKDPGADIAGTLSTFYNFQKVTVRKGYQNPLGLDEFHTSTDVLFLHTNN